jgi:methylmalonyl-CoA/ethylmalonyl-CoA epimerase
MENAAAAAMDGVLAIDHVGVATADLEATIAYYRDLFGFVEVHREENAEQQVIEVMLAAGAGRPAQLQVLAALSASSAIHRFLERSGPGQHHLALRVADLEEFTVGLRARGLQLLYPEARPGTADSKINFIHPRDAGGVLIELVETAEE